MIMQNYLITYSGTKFYVTNPREEDVKEIDIAHALSLTCRANGHCKYFYSVAQHCLNCAREAAARKHSAKLQLACLLHDASEAYISDITRPFKPLLNNYREFESRIQGCIYKKYGLGDLTEEEFAKVFDIDDCVLYHEFTAINPFPLDAEPCELVSLPDFSFKDMKSVENDYLRLMHKLIKEMENNY